MSDCPFPSSRTDKLMAASAMSDAMHAILSAASLADDVGSEVWVGPLAEAQKLYAMLGPILLEQDQRFNPPPTNDADTKDRVDRP